MSRTKRKGYTGAKRFDASCRCHGGCGYCESNRTHKFVKREVSAKEQQKEYVEYSKEPKTTEIL